VFEGLWALLAPRRSAYLRTYTPSCGSEEASVLGRAGTRLPRRDSRRVRRRTAADAKAWLQKAMIEAMDVVLNNADEVDVPVEVEARIARS
jgi:hypothetical protein